MIKKALLFIVLVFSEILGVLGQKPITLEDIYQNRLFSTKTVSGLKWMNNGNYYTSLRTNPVHKTKDIIRHSSSGNALNVIVHGDQLKMPGKNEPIAIDDYSFSNDESKVLITSEKTSIYRRSSRAFHYVYHIAAKKLEPLDEEGKQSYATFSPQGDKVAFVRDNNIFIKDLLENTLTQVTADGKMNEIINGFADWVYEEELSLTRAFFWSPDGEYIAFLRFDESQVPVYNMQKWRGLYPEDYLFKYPKAGEKNSVVTAHVYDLKNAKTIQIMIDEEVDVYLARLQWLPVGNTISLIRLNRLQNHLEIFHVEVKNFKLSRIYAEQTETYFDIDQIDDLTYLKDGQSFIISSQKSGYKHLYHYDIQGGLIRQITSGTWEVSNFAGIDEKKKLLYYLSTEPSSTERHLYTINLNGTGKKKLSRGSGNYTVNFSKDYKNYISTFSSITEPQKTVLTRAGGREIKVLAENSNLNKLAEEYAFAKTNIFYVPLTTGDSLNAFIMKPADFDETRKYPVLMYVYGGPGSQDVLNKWNENMWHHMLTQKGYLVVCVDNRGTGGKGRDFQHITYKHLGKIESEDQIAAARYIAEWPFVDKSRIGIWGWSYGGYMSSLCLFLGNDVFKTAIAVAPVTNWRFYDTIYTERYLQRPQDNPGGYDDFSPINHTDKLKGSFLLIHGTGDDNVHVQNAMELQNALIKSNKQFSSFFYPDRNHSITGGNTRLHLYTMMTNFIVNNL